MNFQNAFSALLLSAIFLGCGEQETSRNLDAGIPVPSKPLPSLCTSNLLGRLNWQADRMAFGFTVEIGTQKDVYSQSFAIPNTDKYFLFTLERGVTTYIRVTKYLREGLSTSAQDIELFVPSCPERATWQKNHPEYKEPFDRLLVFPL